MQLSLLTQEPLPPIILRPYQEAGVQAARDLIKQGYKRILLVLPTGGGKSSMSAAIIAGAIAKGKRALFMAPSREIISQAFWTLVRTGVPEDQCGVIMADGVITGRYGEAYRARRDHAPAQVATSQTLTRRTLPDADVVFVDEAHLFGETHSKIISEYVTRGAVIIGLTGTPVRTDGKGLSKHFDVMHVVSTYRELASLGFLEIPRVFSASDPADLSKVKVTKEGEYDKDSLAEVMASRKVIGSIIDHWKRIAEDRTTLVFASSVENSIELARMFTMDGIPAEHLDGETPDSARRAILSRLASGETTIVTNYGCCVVGFDCPRVKCISNARPTKSVNVFLQMCGRMSRPWNGVVPILIDHGQCVVDQNGKLVHGYPDDDRVWSLDGKTRRLGALSLKICPGCGFNIRSTASVCDHCGHVFGQEPSEERSGPEHVAGELVESKSLQKAALPVRKAWYREVLTDGFRRGYTVEWARHRYRESFAEWPSFHAVEKEFYDE